MLMVTCEYACKRLAWIYEWVSGQLWLMILISNRNDWNDAQSSQRQNLKWNRNRSGVGNALATKGLEASLFPTVWPTRSKLVSRRKFREPPNLDRSQIIRSHPPHACISSNKLWRESRLPPNAKQCQLFCDRKVINDANENSIKAMIAYCRMRTTSRHSCTVLLEILWRETLQMLVNPLVIDSSTRCVNNKSFAWSFL